MAADVATQDRIKRTGLGVLPPATGLQALAALLASVSQPHPRAQTLASVPVDWALLLNVGRAVPFFFTDVMETQGGAQAVGRKRQTNAGRQQTGRRSGRTHLRRAAAGGNVRPTGVRGGRERAEEQMVELVSCTHQQG